MHQCFLVSAIPLLLATCVFILIAQLEKAVCLKYAYKYIGNGSAGAFGNELKSLEETGSASEKWVL
jgi:hypothetical protein